MFTTFTLGDGGGFGVEDRTLGANFKLVDTVPQEGAVLDTKFFGLTHLPDAQLCKEELL